MYPDRVVSNFLTLQREREQHVGFYVVCAELEEVEGAACLLWEPYREAATQC